MTVTVDRRDALDLRAQGLAERYPGLPRGHRRRWNDVPVVAPDGDRLWWVSPFDRHGPVVLPRAQRLTLNWWVANGPHFDAVAIAHELDPDEPLRSALLAQLDGRPRTCDDATARALVGPAPAHPVVTRGIDLLDRLAHIRTGRLAERGVDVLLDPIVFGIVAPPRPRHGAPALWYPLTAWRW